MARRARAHQREHPVGPVGHRCPNLLAGDPVHVAVADGSGGQRREVASRPRLGEPLAPELVGAQQRSQEPILLRGGAVLDQRGREDERQWARVRRGPCGRGDSVVVELIFQRELQAASRFRPARGGQRVVDELGVPGAGRLDAIGFGGLAGLFAPALGEQALEPGAPIG